MPRRIVATALVATAALAVCVPVASAEYLMPKTQAESLTSSHVTSHYLSLGVIDGTDSESCRPSRNARLNRHRGKRYHRWVCSWSAKADYAKVCRGVIVMIGSGEDINNTYYWNVKTPARCDVTE